MISNQILLEETYGYLGAQRNVVLQHRKERLLRLF